MIDEVTQTLRKVYDEYESIETSENTGENSSSDELIVGV